MSKRLLEVLRVLPDFDSTSRKRKCCLVLSGNGSFLNGKVYAFSGLNPTRAQSYVDCSIIDLKGETVFANNTADNYGGTTVKCI